MEALAGALPTGSSLSGGSLNNAAILGPELPAQALLRNTPFCNSATNSVACSRANAGRIHDMGDGMARLSIEQKCLDFLEQKRRCRIFGIARGWAGRRSA